MLIQQIGAGHAVIQEENRGSPLENLHREMKTWKCNFAFPSAMGIYRSYLKVRRLVFTEFLEISTMLNV